MTDRHGGKVAREAEDALVERRALDLKAVDRVRPIEHHDVDLPLRRLLHHVRHRRHVGVEAGADVLQVHDHRVDALEHRGRRTPRLAVERVDRQAGLLVGRGRHAGVENPADAVLRAEEPDERHVLRALQQIDRGRAVARDARCGS